jgi:hypothetical protein
MLNNIIFYILIPLKIIFLILFSIIGFSILKNITNENNITLFIIICFKITIYILSYNIEISKEDYNKYMKYLYSDDKFICIFNHISLLDPFILFSTFPKIGFVLNKQKVYEYLNYDDLANTKCGGIFIDANKKNNVTKKIKQSVDNRKIGESVLFISPSVYKLPDEPYNMGEFIKTGAFVNKTKILPIIIKFKDFSIIYNYEKENIVESFLKLFLFKNYKVKIKVCDMIEPDENETINEYKDRVYNIMNNQYKDLKV